MQRLRQIPIYIFTIGVWGVLTLSGYGAEVDVRPSQKEVQEICNVLGIACQVYLNKPVLMLAEQVLSVNEFLIRDFVKEEVDDFYPDPNRKKKDGGEMGQAVLGTGVGLPFGMTSGKPRFRERADYYEMLSLIGLTGDVKENLMHCAGRALLQVTNQYQDPFKYLNSDEANPIMPAYRILEENIPKDQNIFEHLESKDSKVKFVSYLLSRDHTPWFQFICHEGETYCPEKIRDVVHPFVCWHFSVYMYQKYRLHPMDDENPSIDSFYHLKPVDEKYRIPIYELQIEYFKPIAKNGSDAKSHAVDAVYLGSKSDPTADTDISNWYIFDPQTGQRLSLFKNESPETVYSLLPENNQPLGRANHFTFHCSKILWTRTKSDIAVESDPDCRTR